ncbi:MAG TPA: serine O-acetyltransferase [Candidatus Baltobacteraceae bacterium]|nr:serine O-acetyltransferase [Candidatus Baltobacteraceae bacterium]
MRAESAREDRTPRTMWDDVLADARALAATSPLLAPAIERFVQRAGGLAGALAAILSAKLDGPFVAGAALAATMRELNDADPRIEVFAARDLAAVRDRDPALRTLLQPLMMFKGFHALQTYRYAHALWERGAHGDALYLQSRASELFAVDIHPAARIGPGVFIDHATGVVVGETAVIEKNVSILQGVTLGGTGKECGDRHPKVRAGSLIGAGAVVLGNIEIGAGSLVAAGSVVVKPVAPHTTVAGVPAVVVGRPHAPQPATEMVYDYSI